MKMTNEEISNLITPEFISTLNTFFEHFYNCPPPLSLDFSKYEEWSLVKYEYDGDHKMFEELYQGTEKECRQYAYENYTDKEQGNMCLLDWWGREWSL